MLIDNCWALLKAGPSHLKAAAGGILQERWNFQKQSPEVFCKKSCLRNFAKLTGKHLCQSLFFDKVADLRLATLLKKRLWHRCFPVNLATFLRIPFLKEHLRWVFLTLVGFYNFSLKNSEMMNQGKDNRLMKTTKRR